MQQATSSVRAGAVRLLQRVEGRWRFRGQVRAAALLVDRYGERVAGGPFVGMRYPVPAAADLCLPTKLSGRYEQELHDVLESVLRRRWATMIDVGCAAGYYTTGFALRCPEARVIGFEVDDGLADLARRTAAANGVADRVEIRGFCEPDDLSAVLGPDTFVMLDVEGHEAVLADPQRVAGLAAATLLVEVHDFAVKGLSSELLGRFAGSHHLTVLHAARPSRRGVPEASGLPVHLRRWVVDDHRPPGMRWLLCQPKTTTASGPRGQIDASDAGSPLVR